MFRVHLRVGMTGSCGHFVLQLLSTCRTASHNSSSTNLHVHRPGYWLPFSLYPQRHLLFPLCLLEATLGDAKQSLIMVLICSPLMITDPRGALLGNPYHSFRTRNHPLLTDSSVHVQPFHTLAFKPPSEPSQQFIKSLNQS